MVLQPPRCSSSEVLVRKQSPAEEPHLLRVGFANQRNCHFPIKLDVDAFLYTSLPAALIVAGLAMERPRLSSATVGGVSNNKVIGTKFSICFGGAGLPATVVTRNKLVDIWAQRTALRIHMVILGLN